MHWNNTNHNHEQICCINSRSHFQIASRHGVVSEIRGTARTTRQCIFFLAVWIKICQISGSHGGEYKDDSFLAHSVVYLEELDRHFRAPYSLYHQGDCPVVSIRRNILS